MDRFSTRRKLPPLAWRAKGKDRACSIARTFIFVSSARARHFCVLFYGRLTEIGALNPSCGWFARPCRAVEENVPISVVRETSPTLRLALSYSALSDVVAVRQRGREDELDFVFFLRNAITTRTIPLNVTTRVR